MSQSLTDVLIHIVFSTKDRIQMIHPKIEQELHSYIAGICQEHDCFCIAINGMPDHVHILSTLDKNITISNYVSVIKSNSSRWIKTKSKDYKSFTWQNGYGAFSVSRSSTGSVVKYIANQKQHHKKMTFKEELIAMLDRAGVAYDEKYLWN